MSPGSSLPVTIHLWTRSQLGTFPWLIYISLPQDPQSFSPGHTMLTPTLLSCFSLTAGYGIFDSVDVAGLNGRLYQLDEFKLFSAALPRSLLSPVFRLEADFCLHNVSLAGKTTGGDLFTCCSMDEASSRGAGSPRVRLPPTPQV